MRGFALKGMASVLLLSACAHGSAIVTDLGTLGASGSSGEAVNESGVIAGYSYLPTGIAHARGFMYGGAVGPNMVALGTLNGGTNSYAYGLNNSGQIVGYSEVSAGVAHAYRYDGIPGEGGTFYDLGDSGTNSWANDINSSGEVVGRFETGSLTSEAFLYTGTPGTDGRMIGLGFLPGTDNSSANSINDSGDIVGTCDMFVENAFLYRGSPGEGGVMYDLGSGTAAESINNLGQITGMRRRSDISSNAMAFIYVGIPGHGGHSFDLGTLGGSASYGYHINDSGIVVGKSSTAAGVDHAFLYEGVPGAGGRMIDLDAWLDATDPTEGAKWTLTAARDISNDGWITGWGNYNDGAGGLSDGQRAFLIDGRSIVPEAGGGTGLIAVGLLSLFRRRRDRRRGTGATRVLCGAR